MANVIIGTESVLAIEVSENFEFSYLFGNKVTMCPN